MAYQFGTKRSGVNHLQELLKMQEARRVKEDSDAMKAMRQFKFRDVYVDNDGTYKEWKTDNQGNLIDATISKGIYDNALQENKISNQARSDMGLNPVQTTPTPIPEEKGAGFIEGVKKFGKNIASAFTSNKGAEVKEVGDAGRDILQPTNNNAVAGANISVDKTVGGGAVKGSLFDKKIGETSPIIDPNNPTEIAYQKSLQTKKPPAFAGTPETEKAYQQSLSQKGKPPPNMSDREIANMGKKGKESARIDKRRKYLQHVMDVKKEQKKHGVHATLTDSQGFAQDDKRHIGFTPSEKDRFSLPSMADANRETQKQLDNKSFIASAKADNKKSQDALKRHEEKMRPPSPNTASVVYKNRDKTTISPDVRNRVSVPSFADADIFRNPETVQQAGGKRKKRSKSIVAKSRNKDMVVPVLKKFFTGKAYSKDPVKRKKEQEEWARMNKVARKQMSDRLKKPSKHSSSGFGVGNMQNYLKK